MVVLLLLPSSGGSTVPPSSRRVRCRPERKKNFAAAGRPKNDFPAESLHWKITRPGRPSEDAAGQAMGGAPSEPAGEGAVEAVGKAAEGLGPLSRHADEKETGRLS